LKKWITTKNTTEKNHERFHAIPDFLFAVLFGHLLAVGEMEQKTEREALGRLQTNPQTE